jgi:hypothetical protein
LLAEQPRRIDAPGLGGFGLGRPGFGGPGLGGPGLGGPGLGGPRNPILARPGGPAAVQVMISQGDSPQLSSV